MSKYNGPEMIQEIYGTYKPGDGPTVNSDGNKYWIINGYFHREDGPALILANGYEVWYLNGEKVEYDSETWDLKVKRNREYVIEQLMEQ